ncbi:hypothetical protein [Natrinema salaciae]|uniref:Uncharacterized protein n=1 Tax=Natrinema salaciae TaxID=1186196 RepID=A0A1H9GGY4_9EURY|nr:hypothetical protein [Natrinema salaciae]SEQ49327.1 hypothetical protein SAMN04489841_1881 [Natrinema salaciae]
MTALIDAAVLATESELPMHIVGWVTLALSLLVTIAWVAYFYR